MIPEDELPLRTGERRVTSRGQDALDADVARVHDEAGRGYAKLIDLLVNAEALTAAEAEQLAPRISIRVADRLGSPIHYNSRP